MADQQVPVRRRVAVKIIKPGMDSRQVLARFDVERQALAMMDHPNIARALDAFRLLLFNHEVILGQSGAPVLSQTPTMLWDLSKGSGCVPRRGSRRRWSRGRRP